MEFNIKKLSVEMQASTPTSIGEFPGSTLRGALIQAMVYRNCESLRYGKCNTIYIIIIKALVISIDK